jgi:protein ImuB
VSLWFPRLSTDRLQRRRKRTGEALPPDDAPPLVVVAKAANALSIAGLDRRASALGLAVGQPLANARAMLPSLKALPANEAADRALLERIADWCDRFTPFVALDGARALLLDVTGATHRFQSEPAMLGHIRARLTELGFAVRGAMASTALAARALARHRDGSVVAPGEEAAAIATLPIDALFLDPVTTHAFRRAGLKRIGQAAGRDRRELAARFGARMVFALETALGRAETPISPRAPLPDYRAEQAFAEPVATEDIIRATLVELARALGGTLEKHGEGARRLEAAFFRADGEVRRIAVETGAPTRDPGIVERLFRERLDALADPLDPGFGYDLIRLSASRTERATAEAPDFDADAQARREMRFLVDRLSARFGAARVQAFEARDTHIPEAAWAAVPAQHARESEVAWQRIRVHGEAPRRPLRLFARPEPLDVLAAAPAGTPLALRWRGVARHAALAEGAERIAMEWWRHQEVMPTRDYVRLEDTDGRRLWLYRTGPPAQWFVHGGFA